MKAKITSLSSNASLAEWLRYLELRHPQEIHLGLTRVTEVAKRLSLLNPNAHIITVAGTNGKGSVVALLEQMYTAASYRIGAYTSPHLLHFSERIRVNASSVSEAQITEAFSAIEHSREDIFLSYFETATLAAMYCFAQHTLDIIVLEVGLGGRLDATNLLSPDLCVITGIDYDHQAWLGDTLDAIASEKAGILREKIPLIYGDKRWHASVKNKVSQLQCPCFRQGRDFDYHTDLNQFFIKDTIITLDHRPRMQPQAIANALMVVELLQSAFPVPLSLRRKVCETTQLAGRQQIIRQDKLLVLDVSHNRQSVASLAQTIQALVGAKQKIHAVFSALADKDLPSLIAPMIPIVDAWHISALASPRSVEATFLNASIVKLGGQNIKIYATIEEAFSWVWQNVKNDDMVVVFGSFFTVSEVISGALYKKILEK